jgi:hypothetical protein
LPRKRENLFRIETSEADVNFVSTTSTSVAYTTKTRKDLSKDNFIEANDSIYHPKGGKSPPLLSFCSNECRERHNHTKVLTNLVANTQRPGNEQKDVQSPCASPLLEEGESA